MQRHSTPIAANRAEAIFARRNFLLLLAAGAAWLWSSQSFGQTVKDENGNPIRLPGQTVTPDTQYHERQAIQRLQDQEIQDRAKARAAEQEQQIQNDRAQAQQRDNAVQQNLEQQRLDIFNDRDKP